MWLISERFTKSPSVWQKRIEELFDDSMSAINEKLATNRSRVSEEANQTAIEVEVPGLTKDQVSVTVDGRMLTVRAEKRCKVKTEKRWAFSQSFMLKDQFDLESIVCSLENGLLTITIPKKAKTESVRKLTIN